jgi:DNA-binding MarR family transcriptional regulator
MCESAQSKKSTMNLKTKVLFLIERGNATKDIIWNLNIAKTNLALITSALEHDGLITKTQKLRDKREKNYTLTDKGIKYLSERKEIINALFKTLITSESDLEDASNKIDEVLDLLSFVG